MIRPGMPRHIGLPSEGHVDAARKPRGAALAGQQRGSDCRLADADGAVVRAELARDEHLESIVVQGVSHRGQKPRVLKATAAECYRPAPGSIGNFPDQFRSRGDDGLMEAGGEDAGVLTDGGPRRQDRKSTRLNSSHGYISYAVFCL